MWSAEDVARDQVRRQANGLDIAAIDEKVTEADRRRQETAQDARLGVSAAFEDVERLAEIWAAKAAEWRRVRDVVAQAGWEVYATEGDVKGAAWAREHEERRAAALEARAAFEAQRRDAADELRTQV
ncbi:hypothetical protein [Streptomyces sp. NPDC055299]